MDELMGQPLQRVAVDFPAQVDFDKLHDELCAAVTPWKDELGNLQASAIVVDGANGPELYIVEGADVKAATATVAAHAKGLLVAARARRAADVKAALAATDWWAARALEEGTTLSDGRKKYRTDLRALFSQIAASEDPDSITIPPEPAPK